MRCKIWKGISIIKFEVSGYVKEIGFYCGIGNRYAPDHTVIIHDNIIIFVLKILQIILQHIKTIYMNVIFRVIIR